MQTPQAATPNRSAALDGVCDNRLAERAVLDTVAFAELYDRYLPRVYRYAYRRLGVHADAEDLTAQTFQRALEAIERYEPRGAPFGAWLFRIAHNLVVDRYRARRGDVPLDGSIADPPDLGLPPPEAALVAREEASAAWAAVGLLPPLQRRAVTLRFGQDLSHADVGRRIGRSEAATKQLVYRAMQTLRARLGAEEGSQHAGPVGSGEVGR